MSYLEEQIRDDIFEYQVNNGLEVQTIEDMSLKEALRAYLEWNGIFGYLDYIMKIIEIKGGNK